MAQGAAQAVEDAAALGVVLSNISSAADVPVALRIYEQSRKQRAETIQAASNANSRGLHLHDGPEQEGRDRQFANPSASRESADKWTDEAMRRYLWDWDPEKAAWECFQGRFKIPVFDVNVLTSRRSSRQTTKGSIGVEAVDMVHCACRQFDSKF